MYSELTWDYIPACWDRTSWLLFKEVLDWLKNVFSLVPKSVSYAFKGVIPTKNIESLEGLILPFRVSSTTAVIRHPTPLTWFVISGPVNKAATDPIVINK